MNAQPAMKEAPASRFVDNGDGTVIDTTYGLMWTKATIAKDKTHKQAEAAVKKLDVAGHSDWRLPTVEELFLLADRTRKSPAIDTDVFPDTANDWYWTSTDSQWAPGASAWIVHFDDGNASTYRRNYYACVRAVRSMPDQTDQFLAEVRAELLRLAGVEAELAAVEARIDDGH